MSAAAYERALLLALRSDDVNMAERAAAMLRAMGWTAKQVRKSRTK